MGRSSSAMSVKAAGFIAILFTKRGTRSRRRHTIVDRSPGRFCQESNGMRRTYYQEVFVQSAANIVRIGCSPQFERGSDMARQSP
jgi:hypothetical protein